MENFNFETIIFVLLVLLIHWFADFVMQDGEWAVKKSKEFIQLTNHTITYTLCWLPFLIFLRLYYNDLYDKIWIFLPITFISHTITDYYTSRYTSKQYEKGNFGTSIPRGFDFFVMIGFDQFLHYLQLFLTFYLISTIK